MVDEQFQAGLDHGPVGEPCPALAVHVACRELRSARCSTSARRPANAENLERCDSMWGGSEPERIRLISAVSQAANLS